MTYKELQEALSKLEELGVDMNEPALVASYEGVRQIKSVFTNSLGVLYMDVRK